MRGYVISTAAVSILLGLGLTTATAQPQYGNVYSGHAAYASGVELLGIEPEPNSSAAWGRPDFSGRAVQVQYPLDNNAYSGPEAGTPSGYPLHAPGTEFPVCPPPGCEPDPGAWLKSTLGWESTWVAGGSDGDSLGLWTNEVRAKLEFPAAPVLAATPRFGWHLVDGPVVTDLPAQLFDASVETVLSLPLGERLFLQTAVSPSIFTDGDNTSGDAFRLPSRLLVFWTCTEKLTLSGGVVYLDREDVDWLPSAGLIYKPSDDWRVELLIPRPRVAWRYANDGSAARWVYVVGEFGGGSWAIERAAGTDDVVTLSDYRLLLGWELTNPGGVGCRIEGGYVFNRTLEYRSAGVERDLPGTGLVRFAITY